MVKFEEIKFNIFKNLFNLKYNSLAMLFQVFSIILLFIDINFNIILQKFIKFFGGLTFGIYLIHDNKFVRKNIIKKMFIKLSNDLNISTIIYLIIIKGLEIYIICFLIDFLRYKLFLLLKIRNFCSLIEKKYSFSSKKVI